MPNDRLSSDLASLAIAREEKRPRSFSGLIVVALLLAGGGGAYVFGKPYLEGKIFKVKVDATEIALLSPAQAQILLTSTGYVMPQTVSKVGAKIQGRISKVLVKEGSQVKAGDLIVLLDDVDQKSAIATARSRSAAAAARAQASRANLAEAEQQARRERALAGRGVSPEATAQDLEARARSLEEVVKAADAEVRAADAEVSALSVNLQHTVLRAPIDGTVVSKPAEVGELVGPQSNAVLELADLRTLEVETDVPEGRLHIVKVGTPTEISLDAFPGRRLRGRVKEINPRVNRAKGTVTVKVAFEDPTDGILPDMAARTSILSAELDANQMAEKPKLVVPGSAVTLRGDSKVVFVLDGDVVHMTPVTLGEAFGSGFEVKSGPPAGTRIVANPAATLSDGTKIQEK